MVSCAGFGEISALLCTNIWVSEVSRKTVPNTAIPKYYIFCKPSNNETCVHSPIYELHFWWWPDGSIQQDSNHSQFNSERLTRTRSHKKVQWSHHQNVSYWSCQLLFVHREETIWCFKTPIFKCRRTHWRLVFCFNKICSWIMPCFQCCYDFGFKEFSEEKEISL